MTDVYVRLGKRAFDIGAALILIIALSPVLLAVALAIFLDDPGSPLFRQTRVGKDKRPFRIIKFRSMRTKAPPETAAASAYSESDPRITRVGRIIRATSLDELPQLFNILAGSMSLIGPRPIVPAQLTAIRRDQEGRFRVRPGITGLAQVSGRRELAWPDQLALDSRYADKITLLGDLKIFLRTFAVVFRASDVYGDPRKNWRNFISHEDQTPP
ncbi:sugar transferase [Brevundimonas sp.]|uniref:sugar transferase n=1 Tax=Brevundimonas sp. TaxID=1871086 RepID=UPI002D2FCC3A|nr:sugar transferase [Brevundimonas sp.]HYD28104.1 sugar transferase [Brevundimonas sp.]